MEPTHVPQLSTWGFAQASLRPGEQSGHRGSPPSRGLQSLWHVDRGRGHWVGSRPSDSRHRGLAFVCVPPFLSVQAVTHPGPQLPSLQVRRPELTQAEFRFLSEEAGRATWGSGGGGEGTSLSCSFSGGRLDSRGIPGSPLPPTSPPSPTAPEVQAGLIVTHLRALSTGQPPRSHQRPPT